MFDAGWRRRMRAYSSMTSSCLLSRVIGQVGSKSSVPSAYRCSMSLSVPARSVSSWYSTRMRSL